MTTPAMLTRLTPGRTYRVLGEPGLEYLGQTGTCGQHMFRRTRPPAGTVTIQDPRLVELTQRGDVIPEGPHA